MPEDVTVKVFKYDELTQEAQKKAREWYLEDNPDTEWTNDNLKESFKEQLKAVGIYTDGQSFSWDTDRGQFFCVSDAEVEDKKLFLEFVKKYAKASRQPMDLRTKAWRETINYDGISIRTQYHAGARCENYIVSNDETEQLMTDALQDLYGDFLKQASDEYNYIQSDEYVDDTIRANEYTFLEDGERFEA